MAVKPELTIWTIGHSTRPIKEFLDLLAENHVETVADVRSYPGSRRHPQYGQDALRDELRLHGFDYYWLSALGGRRRARPDSLNTVWRNASFRGYADYMQTPQFTDGLEELLLLAMDKNTTLMCSEAVWWRCHRSMIADALKARGIRVLHIIGANGVTDHPYTAPARIHDGQLTYSKDGQLPMRFGNS
jgi:uncharacterized protein (DUF488 family)